MHLRIATRSSALALWQARHVLLRLRQAWPGLRCSILPITSSGDADRSTPLYRMGVVGVFCKEVHAALLDGEADLGVHSCKDLPTAPPEGIALAAVLERANPRDALIGAASIAVLPPGARVGSSSLRRRAQLAALRPDLRFEDLRGNLPTRLAAVREGRLEATLLAAAGLRRLGLHRGTYALDPWREMVPAPAQGAIAIDCLAGRAGLRRLLEALDHRPSRIAVAIERAVLAGLHGGCSLPLGCHAAPDGLLWRCRAVLERDGELVSSEHRGLAGRVARAVLDDLRS
jgi:hydroxymethylbilane synthase